MEQSQALGDIAFSLVLYTESTVSLVPKEHTVDKWALYLNVVGTSGAQLSQSLCVGHLGPNV